MTKPRIGILGSGNAGQTLGAGLAKAGYDVKLGTRSPEKLRDWAAKNGPRASVGSFADAAKFGQMVVFAVKGDAVEAALRAAGEANLAGKPMIDTTNALTPTPKGMALFVGGTDSLGERIQKAAPSAHVVKAWNWIGAPGMVNPSTKEGQPIFFLAGNHDAAKRQVEDVARDLGWSKHFDLGGIENSRYLEGLAMVYIVHGMKTGNWSKAFTFLGA